jgi:hypothetical protein
VGVGLTNQGGNVHQRERSYSERAEALDAGRQTPAVVLVESINGVDAPGPSFLRELREFLAFVASLWGTLTAVSLTFPLSNVFVRVIPLEGEESFNPLALMPSAPIAATAALVTLFVVLATFGRRHELTLAAPRSRLRRGAVISLAAALSALALYLVGLQAVQDGLYGDTGGIPVYKTVLLAAGDLTFGILYTAFFALTTRGFMILAMLEYFPASGHNALSARGAPDVIRASG